jgi:hypothetical protein
MSNDSLHRAKDPIIIYFSLLIFFSLFDGYSFFSFENPIITTRKMLNNVPRGLVMKTKDNKFVLKLA